MSDVGTLKELDVKPGDVVECVNGYTHAYTGEKYTVNAEYEVNGRKIENINLSLFRIISRANAIKLWRDMTDAEKGALLLAHHEGKEVQGTRLDIPDDWRRTAIGLDNHAYRIRPEPQIEVVTVHYQKDGATVMPVANGYTHRITFNKIDGNPDTASIKMEAI